MKLRLVKHRKFKRDTLQVFVYIGERNLDAADRFLQALDSDLKKLAQMPGMGPARDFTDPRLAGIRSWPVSGFLDYLIFYRHTDERLEALRPPRRRRPGACRGPVTHCPASREDG